MGVWVGGRGRRGRVGEGKGVGNIVTAILGIKRGIAAERIVMRG